MLRRGDVTGINGRKPSYMNETTVTHNSIDYHFDQRGDITDRQKQYITVREDNNIQICPVWSSTSTSRYAIIASKREASEAMTVVKSYSEHRS